MRMQWYGLYHDKPKVGYFMLRVKVPSGVLTPTQAADDRRALAALRPRPRRADHPAEHPAPLDRLGSFPRCFAHARSARADDRSAPAATASATSPAARLPGSTPASRSTCTPLIAEAAGVLLRRPRVLGPAAQAQDHHLDLRPPVQRAGDQLHRPRRHAPRDGRAGLRACEWAAASRRRRASRDDLGRLRSGRGGAGGAAGDRRRLARRPPVPAVARARRG